MNDKRNSLHGVGCWICELSDVALVVPKPLIHDLMMWHLVVSKHESMRWHLASRGEETLLIVTKTACRENAVKTTYFSPLYGPVTYFQESKQITENILYIIVIIIVIIIIC